ncbi:hypothetical protein QBC46DRAFT_266073, partial [Diplogelasinospora grovesii]
TLINFLTTLSFHLINTNNEVFVKNGIYIVIYINNLLIINKDKEKIKALKEALSK